MAIFSQRRLFFKSLIVFTLFILQFNIVHAQQGIGVSQPHQSALFEVSSTTKGILIPRMTTAQINAIVSPANGLLVMDTTAGCLKKYSGTTWNCIDGNTASPQAAYAEVATHQSISGVIPHDNTLPQNTEGTQILTANISPAKSTSKLKVTVTVPFSTSSGQCAIVSVFRDGGANAVYANSNCPCAPLHVRQFYFTFEVDAVAATSTTFNVRLGVPNGTAYLNGNDLGTTLGGSMKATLAVEEIFQ